MTSTNNDDDDVELQTKYTERRERNIVSIWSGPEFAFVNINKTKSTTIIKIIIITIKLAYNMYSGKAPINIATKLCFPHSTIVDWVRKTPTIFPESFQI